MSSISGVNDLDLRSVESGYNVKKAKNSASSKEFLRETFASISFYFASYLTDPVCKSHEYFRRIYVVDSLNPNAFVISNLARKTILIIGVVAWGALGVVTAFPAIGLRYVGSYVQKNPYIHEEGVSEAKILPKNKVFTLLSWNVCGPGAGYTISDGGVLPWPDRLDSVVKKIIEKDADVNCLYEVFDLKAASHISEKLKAHGYKHCYFHIGPRAIGVSSGILVASKYEIENPEFTLFPQDTLVGRTKFAAKGVFGFDLSSSGKSFARIYATHLQHSEVPEFPTAEEVKGRQKQMDVIIDKINAVRDRSIVVTGDLNLDDKEYDESDWKKKFKKGDDFKDSEKTWGGDDFCARMVGKPVSGPLSLDHTMVVKGTAKSINTKLVEVGFDSTVFKKEALSDHAGIFSRIGVK